MTCITYRNGIMAGDGRETVIEDHESSYVNRDDDVKVFRLEDGRLFGASKTTESCIRLYESLVKGFGPPKLEDINALLVDTRGRVFFFEGIIWQPIKVPYYAIGSGARFALPAMDANASAIQACKIGMKRDPYSGGKMVVVRLRK
jgi:hypothetical protein